MRSLQDGIYYTKGSRPGQSMGIIFLRTNKSSRALEIGETIKRIWNTCNNLKKGILKDFKDNNISHPDSYRDLTILIGYSPKIFDLQGAFRKKPILFQEGLVFSEPMMGSSPIYTGSDLQYHEDVTENHASNDDIIIQFIAESSFITNQCIVEVWHELSESRNDAKNISLTKFYDGFRRSDNRNWMGFHDGLSNIKSEERKDVISINQSQVGPGDNWMVDGTFMAFIRIYVDLAKWWQVSRDQQEIMVGRDKVSGCPVTGINETTGKIITMKGCPSPGTKEVTDEGNEIFRNHPKYGFQQLPPGVSDETLKFSHVGEMSRFTKDHVEQKLKYGIFRQGYEFLERIEAYPGLRAGLNFISFQDDPRRLFNTITNANMQTNNLKTSWTKESHVNPARLKINSYFRVAAAGIFFIPPRISDEIFPGSSIFFPNYNMKQVSNYWKR